MTWRWSSRMSSSSSHARKGFFSSLVRGCCARASFHPSFRSFASSPRSESIDRLRNIGISAHIDSGKTTLTERILFFTGRIHEIHEVRGKDGVGAKMDSMDLEREKGITIQSAATHCSWGENHINIIDTPGHVDFTIEVERALRVLDGAILVLCSVAGVQSQSITVDRQMKRYNVPRLAFINKLDRSGANPFRVTQQLREKLHLNAAAVQIPIGLEDLHVGVVDLVTMSALYFEGDNGQKIRKGPIPPELESLAHEKRHLMIEKLADADEIIAEMFLVDEEPSLEQLKEGIRRAVIARKFVPVLMGSAFKNKGVQSLLDAVIDYLPDPTEVDNFALDRDKNEEKVLLRPDPNLPLVGLAFKLEEGRFGQLTYMRVYQGTLKRGDTIINGQSGKKVKVPRLVRMHASEMEDIESIGPGEICAMFGVECSSGDTFIDGRVNYGMTSMFVPDPVVSLSISPKKKDVSANFSKALSRFSREDPTFRVATEPESGQTIISGMGELHLEIYVERMKREYNCEVETGRPYVAYREAFRSKAPFDYAHKKQSGGAGQFGKVVGYIEPLPEDHPTKFEFVNELIGNAIPPQYIAACEKGFAEAIEKGQLLGHPVWGARVVLQDGQSHPVDSSELAFRIACVNAFRVAFAKADPCILEPVMEVEVQAPLEFQGSLIGQLNRRKGTIVSTDTVQDNVVIIAQVPLNNMFGFSTDLRSLTEGKGEYSMEYKCHNVVPASVQEELVAEYAKKRAAERK